MNELARGWLAIAGAGLLGAALALGPLLLGRFVRPRRPSTEKALAYESGVDPGAPTVDGGGAGPNVRYYLYALLFVIFDVEVAFVVPWAVQVEELGVFGLVEMGAFIGVLTLGLAYAWRKGALQWQ